MAFLPFHLLNPHRTDFCFRSLGNRVKSWDSEHIVLGDPEKRRQYDQFGTAGNVGNIFGSPFAQVILEDLMKDFGGSGLGKPISRLSADLVIGKRF